jgi:acyl-CoA hydrolase
MEPILNLFRPGSTIYLPGASGETLALAEALTRAPERMRGVHIISCLLPGFNSFDYSALAEDARLTTFLFVPALRTSFEARRVRVVPLGYTGIADYLAERLPIDLAIAHVAPPDNDGRCSLGIAADFTPIAWAHAKRRALVINRAMPAMRRGIRFDLADADVVVEVDHPVIAHSPPPFSPLLDTIARTVAELVPDKATIQVGLGGAPGAVWPHLSAKRGLVLGSGLVSHGFDQLATGGALAPGGDHRAGIALGDEGFYRFLAGLDNFRLAPVTETHGPIHLAKIDRFHAINSAIEVDLFGQANLEWVKGRMVSGIGGGPGFARAAIRSRGGRSILALSATAGRGQISRLVSRIDAPSVSLGRADIDTVVTEYGVAELRDRSLDERAGALIAIADPAHRSRLGEEWSALRATL